MRGFARRSLALTRPDPSGIRHEVEVLAGMRETDSRVQDPTVLDEIELYGDLVIAASSSDRPLSQTEIDRVLGVVGGDEPSGSPGGSAGPPV
jgi:hypothetical protein